MHLEAGLSAGRWPSTPYSPVWSSLRSTATVHCHCWSCTVLEASVHLATLPFTCGSVVCCCVVQATSPGGSSSLHVSAHWVCKWALAHRGTCVSMRWKLLVILACSLSCGWWMCVYAWTSDKLHLSDKILRKLNPQLFNMSSLTEQLAYL